MMNVISGESLPPPDRQAGRESGNVRGYLPVLFVLTLVAGGVLRAVLGRLAGSVVTGAGVAVVAWLLSGAVSIALVAGAIALLFTLFGSGLGAFVGGRAIGGPGEGPAAQPFGAAVVALVVVVPRAGGSHGPQTRHKTLVAEQMAGDRSLSVPNAARN